MIADTLLQAIITYVFFGINIFFITYIALSFVVSYGQAKKLKSEDQKLDQIHTLDFIDQDVKPTRLSLNSNHNSPRAIVPISSQTSKNNTELPLNQTELARDITFYDESFDFIEARTSFVEIEEVLLSSLPKKYPIAFEDPKYFYKEKQSTVLDKIVDRYSNYGSVLLLANLEESQQKNQTPKRESFYENMDVIYNFGQHLFRNQDAVYSFLNMASRQYDIIVLVSLKEDKWTFQNEATEVLENVSSHKRINDSLMDIDT